jgi:hypothetical protein
MAEDVKLIARREPRASYQMVKFVLVCVASTSQTAKLNTRSVCVMSNSKAEIRYSIHHVFLYLCHIAILVATRCWSNTAIIGVKTKLQL